MKECNKTLVIYYHRVTDLSDDPFLLCVSKENFETHMKYIKDNYNISRFDGDWDKEKCNVVVTFDDGYADNYKNALPILEKYQVPATIFISTGHLIDNSIMWWDELFELIVKQNKNDMIEIHDIHYGCTWKTTNHELKLNCYYAIHKLMNHFLSLSQKNEWMMQLRKQVNIEEYSSDYAMLTCEEIIKLSESEFITIGGHTKSHMSLGKLTKEEQENEIRDNLSLLEMITLKKISTFSYPFGTETKDVNKDTLDLCKQYGIKRAATTTHRLYNASDNELLIPRCEIKNWNEEEFINRINFYMGEK